MRQVVAGSERVLGADHPLTTNGKRWLDHCAGIPHQLPLSDL